jgi:hypothetical protein
MLTVFPFLAVTYFLTEKYGVGSLVDSEEVVGSF